MTKKEFWDKWNNTKGNLDDVTFGAMEEWAEQQGVAFSEWASEQGWEKHVGENTWRNRFGYVTEYATGELYKQYLLQSKQ